MNTRDNQQYFYDKGYYNNDRNYRGHGRNYYSNNYNNNQQGSRQDNLLGGRSFQKDPRNYANSFELIPRDNVTGAIQHYNYAPRHQGGFNKMVHPNEIGGQIPIFNNKQFMERCIKSSQEPVERPEYDEKFDEEKEKNEKNKIKSRKLQDKDFNITDILAQTNYENQRREDSEINKTRGGNSKIIEEDSRRQDSESFISTINETVNETSQTAQNKMSFNRQFREIGVLIFLRDIFIKGVEKFVIRKFSFACESLKCKTECFKETRPKNQEHEHKFTMVFDKDEEGEADFSKTISSNCDNGPSGSFARLEENVHIDIQNQIDARNKIKFLKIANLFYDNSQIEDLVENPEILVDLTCKNCKYIVKGESIYTQLTCKNCWDLMIFEGTIEFEFEDKDLQLKKNSKKLKRPPYRTKK